MKTVEPHTFRAHVAPQGGSPRAFTHVCPPTLTRGRSRGVSRARSRGPGSKETPAARLNARRWRFWRVPRKARRFRSSCLVPREPTPDTGEALNGEFPRCLCRQHPSGEGAFFLFYFSPSVWAAGSQERLPVSFMKTCVAEKLCPLLRAPCRGGRP